jgi:hypothetical protein
VGGHQQLEAADDGDRGAPTASTEMSSTSGSSSEQRSAFRVVCGSAAAGTTAAGRPSLRACFRDHGELKRDALPQRDGLIADGHPFCGPLVPRMITSTT